MEPFTPLLTYMALFIHAVMLRAHLTLFARRLGTIRCTPALMFSTALMSLTDLVLLADFYEYLRSEYRGAWYIWSTLFLCVSPACLVQRLAADSRVKSSAEIFARLIGGLGFVVGARWTLLFSIPLLLDYEENLVVESFDFVPTTRVFTSFVEALFCSSQIRLERTLIFVASLLLNTYTTLTTVHWQCGGLAILGGVLVARTCVLRLASNLNLIPYMAQCCL